MWLMLLRTFAMASCKLRTHQNHPALCFGKREGICSAGGNRELGIGGGREGGVHSQIAAGMQPPKATHGCV